MHWSLARQGQQKLQSLPDPVTVGGAGARAWPTQACCCSAQPMVKVLLPPSDERPRTVDMYLCGHHYRASQARLDAVGASAYDAMGVIVISPDDLAVLPSRD